MVPVHNQNERGKQIEVLLFLPVITPAIEQ